MGKKTLGTTFLFPFCSDEGTLQATLFVACWESSDNVSDNVSEDASDGSGEDVFVLAMAVKRFNVNWH